ncbi:helix-turn-helix domain-containing protein [Hymenobacter terrenus]|uniref:helix-turn-helix domain-containing protein n=1 Tax=Hymenobacter terrenus TaxID=1629124 RepID=UPI000698F00F|nr:helix-turn-helix domain-containing protein [Hymenobacter terrenus]
MVRWIKNTPPGLLGAVRKHFGLSQADVAGLLGVSQPKVNDAEAGTRPLPAPAARRLRALAALLATPPGPPLPVDWAPVAERLAQCRAQAEVLRVRLAHEVPARAAAAAARLDAAEALPAALAAIEAAPLTPAQRQGQLGQLLQLQGGAAVEWHTHSGPAPAALLAARHAGLLAEAAALAQALAAEKPGPASAAPAGPRPALAKPDAALTLRPQVLFPQPQSQPNPQLMPTPDLSGVKSQRTVDALLPPLTLKRDVAGARKGTLGVEIQTFGSPEARQSEAARLTTDIAEAQADLATLTDPKLIGAAQAEIGRLFTRQGRLTSQAESRGEDDRELLKYELHIATLLYDEAAAYVDALVALRPSLPA